MSSLLQHKLMSATEAIDLLGDGQTVVVPTGAGEPPTLLTELSKRRREFHGVTVSQILATCPFDYFDAETADNVRHSAYFLGGAARPGAREGYGDVVPTHFSMIPEMLRRGVLPVHAVFSVCSPPNENDYVYLGLAADYTMAAISRARTVVLEMHPGVPQTNGMCRVHLSEVTGIVESRGDLTEIGPNPIGPTEIAIAEHVAELIPDGATLQIGYGSIPDAIVQQLTHKHDLGVHTEMFGNGLLDLIESGAVTNERKSLHTGQTVLTFAMGSLRLYEYLHRNPKMLILPVDLVNDPYLAGQNDLLHSINGSLQIDLIGQCGSESLGSVPYSGTGGQTDFVRAANRSRGGKSFIVLPSTAKGGTISRIVPVLAPGTHVTTPKNDTDLVVTEFGVARLRGKNLNQRARELIAIAHPDFRDELLHAATALNLVY